MSYTKFREITRDKLDGLFETKTQEVKDDLFPPVQEDEDGAGDEDDE